MDIVYSYLLKKGFKIQDNENTNSILYFSYSFTIDRFAKYNISITSYTNWVFRMETEKKSLSNSVVGFCNHTCFFGVISSENPIEILEVLFNATGINTILENHSIDKLLKEGEQ